MPEPVIQTVHPPSPSAKKIIDESSETVKRKWTQRVREQQFDTPEYQAELLQFIGQQYDPVVKDHGGVCFAITRDWLISHINGSYNTAQFRSEFYQIQHETEMKRLIPQKYLEGQKSFSTKFHMRADLIKNKEDVALWEKHGIPLEVDKLIDDLESSMFRGYDIQPTLCETIDVAIQKLRSQANTGAQKRSFILSTYMRSKQNRKNKSAHSIGFHINKNPDGDSNYPVECIDANSGVFGFGNLEKCIKFFEVYIEPVYVTNYSIMFVDLEEILPFKSKQ